jgi:hypothetical protein
MCCRLIIKPVLFISFPRSTAVTGAVKTVMEKDVTSPVAVSIETIYNLSLVGYERNNLGRSQ